MTASTLGFVLEVLLFLLGLYIYLFARGIIRFGRPEVRARAETFRRENAGWMRLLGLALAAIMLINLVFHLTEV